jgi:predicted ATP-grasp superfamily ATP-dependent carboligase
VDELRIDTRPSLERPVLVAAFRGWNDGGQAATLAVSYLAREWDAVRFADIDPEGFFDFQVARPHVTLVDGRTRKVDWPETAFLHARPADFDRDVVLLLGLEPNVRWRTFTGLVVGLARDLGVELVVTLGALLADVPHTRPPPVTGSASSAELAEELGPTFQMSRYEGPTGIVGVLHDACVQGGLKSASLWAAVPHYVSLAPNPSAALSLCQRLGDVLGSQISTKELEEARDTFITQVSEAVSTDADTAAYVEELEQRAEALGGQLDVPSGDSIAAELTRFLREREKNEGDEPPREQ